MTYWIATNNPPDNLKKWKYFERFGIADGLIRLAKEFPPQTRAEASSVNLKPLGEIA